MRGEKGFTLIEVVVVMIILGILATTVTLKIIGRVDEARRVKAQVDIRTLESALKFFRLDNGFYPATEEGLQALVEKPTTGKETPNWRAGGYLEKVKVPLDPWSNEYLYV